jgi:hypothetical protein
MLPLANVFNLFVDEFASLSRRRFPLMLILLSALPGFSVVFVFHGSLLFFQ